MARSFRITGTSLARVALLLGIAPSLYAQTAPPRPPAGVSFNFERHGAQVPRFTLRVSENGAGSYEGEEAPPASPYPGVSSKPDPIDRAFILSAATTAKIFSLAHDLHGFRMRCASGAKNIADTGKKTLTYKGPDGEGTCTYNYSESKGVTLLTEMFQGIAETMDEGRRLDQLHRYDRLGLDAAMASLAEEVAEGHALELGTIQATLRSIAGDSEVMERVRSRANKLLGMVPAGVRTSGP
jgi:hypothetical protein